LGVFGVFVPGLLDLDAIAWTPGPGSPLPGLLDLDAITWTPGHFIV
jgi:hypothetical protein